MAITRLMSAGAETRSVKELTYSLTLMAPSRGGDYSFRARFAYTEYCRQKVATFLSTRQIRGGFAVYRGDSVATSDYTIFTIQDSSNNALVQLMVDVSENELALKVTGSQADITTGNSWPGDIGQWDYIGFDVYIHSSAGWVEIEKNGVSILSFSGNTGNVDIDELCYGSLNPPSGGSYHAHYYDDIYVDDTTGEGSASSPPMYKFEWIYPDATGNYDGWVGSDSNNTDNYALVDERPPVEADYVEEDTVDQFDSYTMTTYTLGAGEEITAVIPMVYAQRYGAAEDIALGTRYSGTDVIGSDQDPGAGAYTYTQERQTTKPGGGAWDQTSLTGVEVVIKSRGTF